MRTERAQAIAEQALGALASAPEDLGRFLAESGLSPEALRAALDAPADDPARGELLSAVLTFMAADEARAEAFCAAEGLTPESFAAARAALGGETMHWT